MTVDINDEWGVTVSPAKSVGRNQYEAEGAIYRRADMGEDVHVVVGVGRHKVQATNDAIAKARAWVADQ